MGPGARRWQVGPTQVGVQFRKTAGTYGRAAGLVDAATQTVPLRRWSASDPSEPGRWKGVSHRDLGSLDDNVWVMVGDERCPRWVATSAQGEREHLAICQG